jgi:hypothetical protein
MDVIVFPHPPFWFTTDRLVGEDRLGRLDPIDDGEVLLHDDEIRLEHVQWNRAEAARIPKVSYKTVLNKIAECQLKPPPSRQLG